MEGEKFDEGKLRWDLVPELSSMEIAKVFTLGAAKYGDFNWFVGDDGVAPWTAPDLPWSDAQEEAARNFDVR